MQEVLLHLLSFVAVVPWDLCSVSMVCHTLAVASKDESLWRPLGHPAWEKTHVTEKDGWKGAYMTWLRTALMQYISHVEKPAKQQVSTVSYDRLLKALLVGSAGTAKSRLLLRFADDVFSSAFVTTIGIDFKIKTVERNGMSIKMQIWDTAGQERFRTITSAYYRGAHIIYLVYDVSDAQSFSNAHMFKDEISRYAPDNITIVVIAHNDDDATRVVSEQDGRQLAASWNVPYFECSSASGIGVDEAFLAGADLALGHVWQTVAGMALPAYVPDESAMRDLAALVPQRNRTSSTTSSSNSQKKERCTLQ